MPTIVELLPICQLGLMHRLSPGDPPVTFVSRSRQAIRMRVSKRSARWYAWSVAWMKPRHREARRSIVRWSSSPPDRLGGWRRRYELLLQSALVRLYRRRSSREPGRCLECSHYPGDRELALSRWAEASARGDAYEVEYRLRGADGRYRWFLTRALPQRDTRGGVLNWFGTYTDMGRAEAYRAKASVAGGWKTPAV